jgi:hypothetical protein
LPLFEASRLLTSCQCTDEEFAQFAIPDLKVLLHFATVIQSFARRLLISEIPAKGESINRATPCFSAPVVSFRDSLTL